MCCQVGRPFWVKRLSQCSRECSTGSYTFSGAVDVEIAFSEARGDDISTSAILKGEGS